MIIEDISVPALFIAIAFLFPVLTALVSRAISPIRHGPVKDFTYECGEITVGESVVQFNIQYWRYALFFAILDVVAFLMLTWAFVAASASVLLLGLFMMLLILLTVTYSWQIIRG